VIQKGQSKGSRTSAFGMLSIPTDVLVKNIGEVLADIKHERCLAERSASRVFPAKRLRNNLINAMCLNVATQPVGAVKRHLVPNTLNEGRHAKQTVVWNPIWDIAPPGAFLKSRKFCSLVTTIVLNYTGSGGVLQKLKRLAIVIWQMSKRHFMGLCRSIRASMAHNPLRGLCLVKSPEARARTRALTRNPAQCREKRDFARKGQHNAECAAMRLSMKMELVRKSLKCTKCTVAVCTAKWFNHAGIVPVRAMKPQKHPTG